MAAAVLSLAAIIPPRLVEAHPLPCAFRAVGLTCPGCGMARALTWLMHGHVGRAWDRNPRALAVAPLLAWLVVDGTVRAWRAGPRRGSRNPGLPAMAPSRAGSTSGKLRPL